jgi:DENN domain-containing protein 11
VNVPADESQRNAQMLSVGALVPLSYGRLGKSWRHAEGLKELAKYSTQSGLGTCLADTIIAVSIFPTPTVYGCLRSTGRRIASEKEVMQRTRTAVHLC